MDCGLNMVRNIKLILEYDGLTFFGFQKQPNRPTIQETLENALSKFFNCKMKIAAASGRTDAGVHAEGQVVNFKVKTNRDLKTIQKGVNAFLPHTIVVKKAEEVSFDFHSRYSVSSKIYEYRIWNHPFRSPLMAQRVYHVPFKLDISKMKKAANVLKGHHDFKSFTSEGEIAKGKWKQEMSSCHSRNVCHSRESGNPVLDTRLSHKGTVSLKQSGMTAKKRQKLMNKGFIRTIKKLSVRREGHLILFHIEADGFLFHMVRNIVGTLIDVGREKTNLNEVLKILEAKDRRLAGTTAPASALTLLNVTY